LAEADSSYIAQTSARIVRMFQLYAKNIDPESEPFLTFITQYLAEKNMKDPRAIPYPELYKHIKDGIRAYLRESESDKEPNRPAGKSE